ncbi:MAG TPA: diphosphomevalonate decarboxylase [Oleiagrimonas sp.]|nr:diphosphomevalonate decarboxylase [Oleiagrimonas sp.]
MKATARARPNIALVKYWGKRDSTLNLPAAGSLSVTLDTLWTQTTVAFDRTLEHDALRLNGAVDACAGTRVSACLDVLRQHAGIAWRARVDTQNNFPTAAGLASSASGFAALVMAASQALDLPLDRKFLSTLARQGSGSAARSLYGGFVAMYAGQLADGSDAFAEPLLPPQDWPLTVVIAITTQQAKAVGSGEGMERSRRTSPFHANWIASVDDDLAAARSAVMAHDFEALAEVGEHSCLKMHADMLSSRPPLMYWSAATMACMQRIRELRGRDGLGVFFTVDAGPQVKAVCLPQDAPRVAAALAEVPGVECTMVSGLGAGAEILPEVEVA